MQTQHHQGLRLKNLIEKSGKKTSQVALLSGVARSSIYKLFDKKELLTDEVKPILDVIEVSTISFYADRQSVFNPEAYEALKSENAALREQINTLKEMIELLKKKK